MSEQINGADGQSIYERVGGDAAIRAVVADFYDRVLADRNLAPFFKHKQRKGLEEEQVKFFTQALGGPQVYQGRSMKEAHQGLAITGNHFDQVAVHLKNSLEGLGVEPGMVTTIIDTVASLKGDIV
ncbi:MAG: group 1 truncated hemoglobin, partial [Alcanivorax sp.]|nr:group 1 truncated hemoglobin [Alcanivorax sp.]